MAKKQTQSSRQILESVLQENYRGFSYEMMALEMSIEEEGKPLGASKIQDITKLIQLYMIGVESLESKEDSRFKYFTRKLQSLLLRKSVADLLKKQTCDPTNEYMIVPNNEKRREHEMQMYYFKDMGEKQKVQELVRNVETKLRSYEGLVTTQINKQKASIQDRIKMRKQKSETSSLRRYRQDSVDNEPKDTPDKRFEYFDDEANEGKGKNLVKTRHNQL